MSEFKRGSNFFCQNSKGDKKNFFLGVKKFLLGLKRESKNFFQVVNFFSFFSEFERGSKIKYGGKKTFFRGVKKLFFHKVRNSYVWSDSKDTGVKKLFLGG